MNKKGLMATKKHRKRQRKLKAKLKALRALKKKPAA
jgi:hypothetical protein